MIIKGIERVLALLAALLCLAGIPVAAGEDAPKADKLYAEIDQNGFAYVTLAPNTLLYADETLAEESLTGENKVSITVVATGHTGDAVEISTLRAGKLFSVYVIRTDLGNPQKAATIVKRAENAGQSPVEVEGCNVYLSAALIRPLADGAFQQWLADLGFDFYQNFIHENRWVLLAEGLGKTLLMTVGALLIGIIIGVAIALTRTVWEINGAKMHRGLGRNLLMLLNGFFKAYTTVFRGTPMMVQLLLMTFVILKDIPHAMLVAVISFGLNSGAYVAEIFRGGIMAIDKGQTEAGRSIGLNYAQTMWYIIAPQVIKNVLPTLCNEFITLIKETSIAAYAGVMELTMAGNRIRGQTFSDFMPLIAVALIYLVLVMVLTWLVGILERRLRQSDNR